MLRDRRAHGVRVQLPEDGRVLDVGEQEGERLHLRLRLELERRVLVEDPPLELLQLRRGLEAELLRQVRARLLVRTEGFRLAAGAVEREHVLRAEALVDRELLAQHLQLRNQAARGARARAPPRSASRRRGGAAPPGAAPRAPARSGRARRRTGGRARARAPRGAVARPRRGLRLHERSRLLDRPLELDRVHVPRVGCEPVAAVVADDDVADRGPEVRDVRLQRRARPGRRLVAPDAVDQRVDRDRLPHLRRQQREHRALLRAAQAHFDAVAPDFERPEDANLQLGRTIRRCSGVTRPLGRSKLCLAHARGRTRGAPKHAPRPAPRIRGE